MRSDATNVDQYLAEVEPARRDLLERVVELVRANIPEGYVEAMEFGMPSWVIPLEDYPNTYNGRPLGVVAVANQKRHVSIYLMGIYADEAARQRFEWAWAASSKKLNMGKSCVRFTAFDDLAVDALSAAISAVNPAEYIASYERARR